MNKLVLLGSVAVLIACSARSTPPKPTDRTHPAQPASDPSTAPTATPEDQPMPTAHRDFHGSWIYAEDPTGAIPFDGVYEGAIMTLNADGTYSFAMGGEGSMGPMEGAWSVVGGSGDQIEYIVDYGEGQVTKPQTLKLRRDGDTVQGLEQHDGVTAGRFYLPHTP